MKILGIETSCDETAASVVEDGMKILSNVVVSQIDIFAAYGGVIPEVAARSHLEAIQPVIEKSLKDADLTWDDIDAIAVTHTPGLLGSLLIGTLTARTLAILHNKPLYPVHHLKSHIYANWILKSTGVAQNTLLRKYPEVTTEDKGTNPVTTGVSNPSFGKSICDRTPEIHSKTKQNVEKVNPTFPLLAMVISGGHTQILYMEEHNHFEIIGTTLDDAIGECFDKVAKILGLPYPGGPEISKTAKKGNRNRYQLPRPKIQDLNFSFSGLKTAVLRAVQKEVGVPISYPSHELKNLLSEQQIYDFAASFEKTATEIILEKLKTAQNQYPSAKSIVFAGGVSANEYLRENAKKLKTPVFFPEKSLSGDNGAMVASAAYYEIISSVKPSNPYKLNILPRSAIK